MLAPLMIVPLGLLFLVEGQDLDTARLARILGVYFPWALLQQYLVASLVFRRLQLLHAGTAGLLAAAVFAFLHLPNFGLMIATFLLGNLWLYIFRRHGNLLAIAVSHAVLAVCAEELLPAYLLVSKNVGVAYLANL
jgi:membrane protease YdiL (CAAX protease family)